MRLRPSDESSLDTAMADVHSHGHAGYMYGDSGGHAAMDDDELLLLQRQIVDLQQKRRGTLSHSKRKQAPQEEERGRAWDVATASGSGRMATVFRRRDSEIDGFVQFYVERLRDEVRKVRKKHCRRLLAVVEGEAVRRLRRTEAELESARLRSAVLEEKMRQLSTEGQMWVAMTRHHEAAVGVLRASLEQTLLQLQQSSGTTAGREGYDDSEASSAESSHCFAAEKKGRCGRLLQQSGWCMACGRRAARALLLPCKHLCLSEDCEPEAGECPVCGAVKTAGVQVFTC